MKKNILIILGCFFALSSLQLYAQGITITGKVLDSFNEGLPGASVSIKGSQKGVVTGLGGQYTISVPNSKSVLVFSFIGYQSKEEIVGNRRTITVQLTDNSGLLDEVVVIGFGSQKKINATAAVKTVDNSVLESRPISNAVVGLQGVIAGLNITNDNGGGLGQSMNINIRGAGSIGDGSNSSPLVLIDGMEGDLSTINPNDIETISVLKDAASASIYGSRAPFGVILVTTKSGVKGKLTVNYKGNLRISQPIGLPEMVDSYTYALMTNDSWLNVGKSGPITQLKKIKQYQNGELPYGIDKLANKNAWAGVNMHYGNTDWYDVYLKKHATSQEHNLTLNGGGEKVNYYFSANYLGQNGLFNFTDETYQRLGFKGKVNVVFNKYVNMTWNTSLINTENNKPVALDPLFFHNLGLMSPLTPVYLPNGDYCPDTKITQLSKGGRNISKTQQLSNQLTLKVSPMKGWNINIDLNNRLQNPRGIRQFNKITYTLPDGSQEYMGVLAGIAEKVTVNGNGSFTIQPSPGQSVYEKTLGYGNYLGSNLYTDYEKTLGKHYFKVLIGMQTESSYVETNRMATNDILLDERPYISPTAGTILVSEKKSKWTSMGFFGRIDYSFADRYMIETTFRYDGASRFPKDKRWASFPTFSLGWNIAQENFWKLLADVGLEYLKVRGSYGSLGNQNTSSAYPYYQQMNTANGTMVLGGTQASILPVYAPFTSNLTWETVENHGAGFEWGFFKNRFTGSFDWYQRTTKNMLGPSIPLPAVYGASAPKTNTAEMRTRGWEFEIGWRDRIGKNFSYSIYATLSDYQSVVTKYASSDMKIDGWYPGKKFGDLWGFETVGIAKSDDEMANYLKKHSQSSISTYWGGGDIMYRDLDNNGTIDKGSSTVDNHGDLKVIGNSTPRYAYSFTLDAKYKFMDLRVYFQGVGKRDLFFQGSETFFGVTAPYKRSMYASHLDYFRYAGSELGANYENPYFGRLRTDGANSQVCDRFLQSGAYLRLKNLQIGFSLPNNTSLKNYIKNARIYFSGENLLTFTKLRSFDPEAVGDPMGTAYGPGKTYPMYRVWSAGLELTF